jgi:GNAT superfamily N-acetyltransferase
VEIRQVPVSQTYEIRNRLLRPGRPVECVHYDQDKLPSAFHLGAFIDGEHVGTASYYQLPNEHVLTDAPDIAPDCLWQLRGMASEVARRGRGIGTAMLAESYRIIREKGGRVLWCNARLVALEFYKRNGFSILGDEFDVPDIGPHYVMWRRL